MIQTSIIILEYYKAKRFQGQDRPILKLNGLSKSPCGIVLEMDATSLEFEEYFSKAINYVVLLTIVRKMQYLFLD